jgi:O-6-methylguanine DNA methyltransferase
LEKKVCSILVSSPIGLIGLSATQRGLFSVKIGCTPTSRVGRCDEVDVWEVLKSAERELKEYFGGRRREFTVRLDVLGSKFDVMVWSALRSIPYGEVRSYRWLAEQIGYPNAYRAVGRALSRNPLPIFLPCHRVVRADGGLGGYSAGLDVKRFLLSLEKGEPC